MSDKKLTQIIDELNADPRLRHNPAELSAETAAINEAINRGLLALIQDQCGAHPTLSPANAIVIMIGSLATMVRPLSGEVCGEFLEAEAALARNPDDAAVEQRAQRAASALCVLGHQRTPIPANVRGEAH